MACGESAESPFCCRTSGSLEAQLREASARAQAAEAAADRARDQLQAAHQKLAAAASASQVSGASYHFNLNAGHCCTTHGDHECICRQILRGGRAGQRPHRWPLVRLRGDTRPLLTPQPKLQRMLCRTLARRRLRCCIVLHRLLHGPIGA